MTTLIAAAVNSLKDGFCAGK